VITLQKELHAFRSCVVWVGQVGTVTVYFISILIFNITFTDVCSGKILDIDFTRQRHSHKFTVLTTPDTKVSLIGIVVTNNNGF
jgi:hypothetical protein